MVLVLDFVAIWGCLLEDVLEKRAINMGGGRGKRTDMEEGDGVAVSGFSNSIRMSVQSIRKAAATVCCCCVLALV